MVWPPKLVIGSGSAVAEEASFTPASATTAGDFIDPWYPCFSVFSGESPYIIILSCGILYNDKYCWRL